MAENRTFLLCVDILNQILAHAPATTRALVTRSLAEDPDSVRHLRMPNPINLGIAATLGNFQQGADDAFIPLVITEVFGADPTAAMESLGVDPSGQGLLEIETGDEVSSSDGIKRSADSEQIGHPRLPDPKITMADVKAIHAYCRHLAREWWKAEPRQVAMVATCDACKGHVFRDNGYLEDSSLLCEACFDPASKPDEVLDNLQDDADYYGEGLLVEARHFARMRSLN